MDKLLHNVSKSENNLDSFMVLVYDSAKLDFVIGFNDAYQSDIQYTYSNLEIIEPLDDIIIIEMQEGDVKRVLEYRPEEEYLFNKYFNAFSSSPS